MADYSPRIFGVSAGADFAEHFISGLEERYRTDRPEAFARLEIITNTDQLRRHLIQRLRDAGVGFLPKIKALPNLVSDPEWALPASLDAPKVTVFTFLEFVRALARADSSALPAAAVSAFSQSLADLYEEIESEYVDFSDISALESDAFSAHWQRNLEFLRLIEKVEQTTTGAPLIFKTPYGMLRGVIEAKIAQWQTTPPAHPIIIAGSTGSRAPTARLMHVVARLQKGAVVLPALDYNYPWPESDGNTSQNQAEKPPFPPTDHAQSNLARFIYKNGLSPADIPHWAKDTPKYKGRAKLVSLAMRPAPVTDTWREEGAKLGDMRTLTRGLSLICAQDEKTEARALALCLRHAVETGKSASVITPNRLLGRKIATELERWGIIADESAGVPLDQTATGRFIIGLAELIYKATPPALSDILVFLKMPLVARADNAHRANYLAHIRDFEFWARKKLKGKTPPKEALNQWQKEASSQGTDGGLENFENWFLWLLRPPADGDFGAQISDLTGRLQKAFVGPVRAQTPLPDAIWSGREGRLIQQNLESLAKSAPPHTQMFPHEFLDILKHRLRSASLRTVAPTHPNIAIWGSLQARAQRSECTIIAGLGENFWPGTPAPDHWLNRLMRKKVGLISPDRQIGLMAHDFQAAISDGEVILSRSLRDNDGQSVASRWLLRLENFLNGMASQNGKTALQEMQKRGDIWLRMAENLDQPAKPCPPAVRPAPCPPKATRPKKYAPTSIEKLIRDPYFIYAKYILKITPLEGLCAPPDARIKGLVFHDIMHAFAQALKAHGGKGAGAKSLHALFENAVAQALKAPDIDALTRLSWRAEIATWQNWFLESEAQRQQGADIGGLEINAEDGFAELGIALTAKADRIDISRSGAKARIYDYKTGKIPTEKQIQHFSKQLLIEAALLERGAFKNLGQHGVEAVEYIGLNKDKKTRVLDADDIDTSQIWLDIERLLRNYASDTQGFSARRALPETTSVSDYDQLSRFGEWDMTQRPKLIKVGKHDG